MRLADVCTTHVTPVMKKGVMESSTKPSGARWCSLNNDQVFIVISEIACPILFLSKLNTQCFHSTLFLELQNETVVSLRTQ